MPGAPPSAIKAPAWMINFGRFTLYGADRRLSLHMRTLVSPSPGGLKPAPTLVLCYRVLLSSLLTLYNAPPRSFPRTVPAQL